MIAPTSRTLVGAIVDGCGLSIPSTNVLAEACAAVAAADTYAFDLETSSLEPLLGRITGFSVSVDTQTVPARCWNKCCDGATVSFPRAWYFSFDGKSLTGLQGVSAPTPVSMTDAWTAFGPIFQKRSKRMVAHNSKFDIKFMLRAGIAIENEIADTAIASWMLEETRETHKLKDLVEFYFQHKMVRFDELGGLFSPPIDRYGADDASQTMRLWRLMQPRLQAEKLEQVFFELECRIPKILAKMELAGIALDIDLLRSIRKKIEHEMVEVEEECYRIAGKRFLISSPEQIGKLLFDHLAWKHRGEIPRTQKGWSTGKEILQRYEDDHPLAAGVLKWRELAKLDGTYILPLIDGAERVDGRVRSHFHQIEHAHGGGGTVTGRLSSSASELGGTQLQNIPSRSKVGKQLRDAFVAAGGCVLLSADYSQAELRAMAHFSGDPTLMRAYKDWDCVECGESGATVTALHACPVCKASEGHRRREKNCDACKASDVPEHKPKHGFCLGLDLHQITADACSIDRHLAKIVNFALLYGLGYKGLARKLQCSEALAKKIRDAYFKKYAGVVEHNHRVGTQIMRFGYVPTILKRRRRFPHKKGRMVDLRDREWRQGANVLIQGTIADVVKLAMRNLQDRLDTEGFSNDTVMLLQVHDELVLETRKEVAADRRLLVREVMESAIQLRVPLIADVKTGTNWGACKAG